MPALKIDALLATPKGGAIPPVLYLHGAEDLLKEEAVHAVAEAALDPGLREFNFDQRSAAQVDPETLYSLCQTPPMLAARRVVVIRDVEAWKRKPKLRELLLRYASRPSADAVLVLVQGAGEEEPDKDLVRSAASVACEPLLPDAAARWVLDRAARLGISLEPAAAGHLVRVSGPELGPLAAELEKLAALPQSEPISAARVGELVGVRHGETADDWRDAVLEGDAARAARLLAPVLAQPSVNGVRLITLLGSALIALGVARAAYDRGLRGPRLEEAVFSCLMRTRPQAVFWYKETARRWARWLPAWPDARLRLALRAALAADVALKSTTISDEAGILTDLVLELALARRRAA